MHRCRGPVTDYLLLTRRDRVNLMGIRQMHRIGGDNEFERLKECLELQSVDRPLVKEIWEYIESARPEFD